MTSDNWLPLRIGAGGYLTGIDIALTKPWWSGPTPMVPIFEWE
jgi:hypothetical protein